MTGIFDDFRNAFRKPNNGLIQIISINVVIFLALIISKVIFTLSNFSGIYQSIINKLQLPASFYSYLFQPWALFTYFFVHDDFFHILFNMLFLYWFGSLVHEYLGNKRLINIYILGGLFGGLVYMIAYNLVPYFKPMVDHSLMMGASGAAFAVVVAAATLLPDYSFLLLFLGPVRIKYIALFYIVVSFASSIGSNAGGNIAHLGGALIGFIYIKQLRKGVDLGTPIAAVLDFIKSLFVELPPKPQMKVTHRSYTNAGFKPTITNTLYKEEDFPGEDEVDALLDKISRSGYESLTKDEKLKLFKASQK
jgi:membrane associated rhomboid family serine protease